MRFGGARSAWTIALLALLAVISGLILSSRIQAGNGVAVQEVMFTGKSGARMRALLFHPDTATLQNPAPAILAVHGYLNSAEMQGNFATEFARRGYVVLAPDQRGHGGSDPVAFADGFGGPDALAYLRSLPFVDKDNIGLEGHSMGGWTVLAAAKAFPDGYRSMVLEGSSVGAPFAPEGSAEFPRNLMVVFGNRDEFGGFMWGKPAPLNTGATRKAMDLFGSNRPVTRGKLYGQIADGSARFLLAPDIIHAWLHQSAVGIGPALIWFNRTLEGARPVVANLAATDQIWPWREFGGAVALTGLIILISALLAGFSRLFPAPTPGATNIIDDKAQVIAPRAGLSLALIALVPAILYLPACMATEALLGQNWLFRQTFTNQLAGWTLICALLSFVALRVRPSHVSAPQVRRAVLIALSVLAPAYLLVLSADTMLHVSPTWWILSVRPLSIERARDFVIYAPFFVASSIASLKLLDSVRPLARGGLWRALCVAMAALSGGLMLFLIIQYSALFATGQLLIANEGLRVIQMINVAVFFLFIAIFGTVSKRYAGSVLPGGLVAGLFVGWAVTAMQPIGA